MCFTIQDRSPTFAERAQQMHFDHVREVQERHARMSAEEEVERLRRQLWEAAGHQGRPSGERASPRAQDAMDSPRQSAMQR